MASGDVYEKVGGAWVKRSNIATGPPGTSGTSGEKWFSGVGAPASGTGAVGDWYMDTSPQGPQPSTATYGTALPASPSDGNEAILVDNLTNPSWQFRFRYNAGSTSAYKWECIGGSPICSSIEGSASESTASSSYTDLATVGPSIVLPRPGDYLLGFGAAIQAHAAPGGTGRMAISGAGLTAVDADSIFCDTGNSNAAMSQSYGRSRFRAGLTAGTLTAKYRGDGAAASFFWQRWLTVQPVRVS